jgi:hypothetical protein
VVQTGQMGIVIMKLVFVYLESCVDC